MWTIISSLAADDPAPRVFNSRSFTYTPERMYQVFHVFLSIADHKIRSFGELSGQSVRGIRYGSTGNT